MADQITGLCLLTSAGDDGLHRLYHIQSRDGVNDYASIRISSTPQPASKWSFPVWTFVRAGNRLNCHPSVHNLTSGFHNGYNWSVDYVEVASIKEYNGSVRDLHRELNEPGGLDKIPELRRRGVLK